ncbi:MULTISPECIES: PP2C family serine/threonine-protein phosphatase [unclassified Thiocapsa]|uniref:PP2C family serine/threonine-protein phosphatase n=1 Tax=unclassified Thiocapsa TaxID=2641286 RepID=UPI0035B100F8
MLQDGWIGPRLIRRHDHPALCRALAGDRRTRGSACTLALLHWRPGDWTPDDTVLICTDGLHDTLGQDALEALFRTERPLEAQAAVFLDAVLAAGAPDNVSLILVRIARPV